MFRVLHIVSSMNRGGIETFIMNMYRNIDKNKIQFDFLVHDEKEAAYDQEIKELGGKIYFIPARNQGIVRNHDALSDFFSKNREYKIVHQHVSSLTYITPLKLAKRHGVPVRIIHGHSTKQGGIFVHKYLHEWNKKKIKEISTHRLACSSEVANWLFNNEMIAHKDYKIINNGIDTEKYKFSPLTRVKKRKELEINDKFVIGHVGRFAYPKNHNFLIDVFKSFNQKKPNSVLLLIGDGKLREDIKNKCKKLGLEDKVIFTGVRSDIPDLLNAMDVFVMPSHYEGLPVSLVEAQANGLACVIPSHITTQINLTPLVHRLSLDESSESWANFIINKTSDDSRENYMKVVKKSGYDSKEVTEKLSCLYMTSIEETLQYELH